MFAMVLKWLGALLGGPFINAALGAYKAKLDAGNDAGKIAADLAVQQTLIDQQKEALEQTTLIAEEGRWGPIIRWGFALPFMVFNIKIIILDRMFHLGYTDPLSSDLNCIEAVIIAAYFGHSAITIAGRIKARQ